MVGRPAVFLDRDGVINRAVVRDGRPYPPACLEDFQLLPGAAEAVGRLRAAGLPVVVVTNQPDVVTGRQSPAMLDAFHRHMLEAMPVDAIKVCLATEDNDPRGCYKPRPGLLIEAAEELGLDLARSFMVGDRWRDIGAGKAVGAVTFFIDHGYDEIMRYSPDFVVTDLAHAASIILERYARDHAKETENG